MKIPFVGPAYTARSLNADAQRTLNCYLEFDNKSPRAPVALYGTPGMINRVTLGDAPVRGCIVQGSYAYFVAGNSVYAVNTSYTATLIGTIGSYIGPVGMASNGAQVLIVDGIGGWLATSLTLTTITDGEFPAGVRQAAFINGFFIVTGDGTQKFYVNESPNDGASWNGTDFASAEGAPDNTICCIENHQELWLGGADSFEVWVPTANPDFPFERSGNVFIEHGCASGDTLAKLDNTVFWLGADSQGGGIVWRAEGYIPARISTHAIETAIQSYAVISDAFAFTYQQEGHGFYVLTFPTANKTWVYDVATNEWHERAWMHPNSGSLTRWRPSCHVYFNNEHLVGDFETGDVYALDLGTYTDDGDPILRLRATQTMESEQVRIRYGWLQVDMETGVGLAVGQGSDPKLMLRFSDDGGHTWSNTKYAGIGRVGQYNARARFFRLGAARNRLWEISMTDPVKFAVFGGIANVRKGFA